MRVAARRRCAATPAAVWTCLAEPERHVRTLPGAIGERQVTADGHIAGTLSAPGVRERIEVVLEAAEPGRRLVARRVDGGRRAVTTFTLDADGDGTAVAAEADIDVPWALSAFARGPLEAGLAEQLEAVDRLASAGG